MLRSKRVIDPIPDEFETLEEAAEFWDTHDTTDYLEFFEPVEMTVAKPLHRIFVQTIKIPEIELVWSDWVSWNDLASIGKVKVPNTSGVYEAAYMDEAKPFTGLRLTIGKASNLRHRVKQGLVRGKSPHSTGKRIRDIDSGEDFTKIVVRWAETERPYAIEEELHKNYKQTYGKLPKYTRNT